MLIENQFLTRPPRSVPQEMTRDTNDGAESPSGAHGQELAEQQGEGLVGSSTSDAGIDASSGALKPTLARRSGTAGTSAGVDPAGFDHFMRILTS